MSELNKTWDDRYSLINFPYLHYGVSTTGVNFAAGVDSGNAVILVTAPITVTLPSAASVPAGGDGRGFYIKNANLVGTVSVAAAGAEKIDGSVVPLSLTQNQAVLVVSDGSNWWVLAHNP